VVSLAQGPIVLLSPNLPRSDLPRHPASDSLAARLRAIEAPRSWHEPAAGEECKALTPQGQTSPISLGSDASADEIEVAFRISEDALSRLEAGLRAQETKQTSRATCPPVAGLGASSANQAMRSLNPVARSSRPFLFVLIAAAVLIPVGYHLFPRETPTEVVSDQMEPAEPPSVPVVTKSSEAEADPQSQPSLSYYAVSTTPSQTTPGPLTAGPSAPKIESLVTPSSPTVSAGTSGSGRTHHPRLARRHPDGTRPKTP
jgi:hypothetical protein